MLALNVKHSGDEDSDDLGLFAPTRLATWESFSSVIPKSFDFQTTKWQRSVTPVTNDLNIQTLVKKHQKLNNLI